MEYPEQSDKGLLFTFFLYSLSQASSGHSVWEGLPSYSGCHFDGEMSNLAPYEISRSEGLEYNIWQSKSESPGDR